MAAKQKMYIFEETATDVWTEVALFGAPDGAGGTWGWDVAIAPDMAFVTAQTGGGGAWRYDKVGGTWELTGLIEPYDGANVAYVDVDTAGSRVILGSSGADAGYIVDLE